jgi:Nif-specific regulatory protein
MRARLIIEEGEGKPVVCDFSPDERITLGRHHNNTIVLRDEHASRRHAELFFENDEWHIREIDSPRNGTKVNGERIQEPMVLASGSEIRIGATRLRFTSSVNQTMRKRDKVETPPAGTTVSHIATLLEDELNALLAFIDQSIEETDPHKLIRHALALISTRTGANVVGFLSLDPDEPLPKVVLPEMAHVDIHLSRQLTKRIQIEGRAVWLGAEADRAQASESLLPFTDALCVPLRVSDAPLGALHVYKSSQGFTEHDKCFCEVLAGYLAKSLHVLRARRTLEAENSRLRVHVSGGDQLVGDSSAMQQLRHLIAKAAVRSSTVLIRGESGVGKELVALALHRQSKRRDAPLVVVNCAAFTSSMPEAELFGHCKGAFTGADRDRPGLFKKADEGTLFLDEVGELSLECQAKLLRVIEGKGFRPVGVDDEVKVDVRIITATNRDLEREVKAGKFREDLMFRLQVISLSVPPLREHAEDVPALVRYFLENLAPECRRQVKLSDAAMQRLQEYAWPGNVRQLRSVLESSVFMSDQDTLDAGDLRLPTEPSVLRPTSLNLEQLECWAVREALKQTEGNITQAAKLLGIVRDTLANKMKKWGLANG